jgi:hypothetical protein
MGLAGQLDEGNYLFSLSGFPKMSRVFNTRLGTEPSFSMFCPLFLSFFLHGPQRQESDLHQVELALFPESPNFTKVGIFFVGPHGYFQTLN